MFVCIYCGCNICTNKTVYKAFDKNFCSIDCRDNHCNNNSINSDTEYMRYLQTIHTSITNQCYDKSIIIIIYNNYTKKMFLWLKTTFGILNLLIVI